VRGVAVIGFAAVVVAALLVLVWGATAIGWQDFDLKSFSLRQFWIDWWWLITLGVLSVAWSANSWVTGRLIHMDTERVRGQVDAAIRAGRDAGNIRPVDWDRFKELQRDDRSRYIVFLLLMIVIILAAILRWLIKLSTGVPGLS
jgi:hypothetical protein